MGTPAYMAPEQIESAKGVDRRADVFSLGVILYELVSGQRPFQGDSMLAVLNAVAAGRRAPLEEFVPDLPPHYLAAIAGALQVDREARVPNCDALLDLWTGQTRDARGGFSGIWDSTTVDRISRTLVPPSVTSLTDNSETYFPTQGVAAASFVPTSLPPADAMETLSSPVAPPSRRPRLRLGAGVGVVALLSVGGLFATTASGPSPSAPPVPLVTMEPVLPGPSEVVLSEPSPEQTHPKSPTPEPSAPSPSPVGPKPGPVAPGSLVPVEEEQPTPVEEEDPDAPLVTFLSDPDGAQVFLDGLQVGTTPLARFAVPKGRHKVRLELGAASVEEKISVNKRSARTYHWTQATNAWSER